MGVAALDTAVVSNGLPDVVCVGPQPCGDAACEARPVAHEGIGGTAAEGGVDLCGVASIPLLGAHWHGVDCTVCEVARCGVPSSLEVRSGHCGASCPGDCAC